MGLASQTTTHACGTHRSKPHLPHPLFGQTRGLAKPHTAPDLMRDNVRNVLAHLVCAVSISGARDGTLIRMRKQLLWLDGKCTHCTGSFSSQLGGLTCTKRTSCSLLERPSHKPRGWCHVRKTARDKFWVTHPEMTVAIQAILQCNMWTKPSLISCMRNPSKIRPC